MTERNDKVTKKLHVEKRSMLLTNRTVGPIHIDFDKVVPGEIPKLVRHVILGEERYSFHFDDSILWFRRDQLDELQDPCTRPAATIRPQERFAMRASPCPGAGAWRSGAKGCPDGRGCT